MAARDSKQLATGTAAAARRIAEILHGQGQETQRLATEVREVAGVVATTVASTRQTQDAAKGLRLQAVELERLTARFKLRE